MKTIFLVLTLIVLNACTTAEKATCDQAALDAESVRIGAYEITCEELEAL